jgi:tetratricopeptide (TPR) repeat protein
VDRLHRKAGAPRSDAKIRGEYNSGMASAPASLVDILREFLSAHEQLDQLAEKYKRDELVFSDLREFVGDSDNSVLFRLKEKCHSLFRPEAGGSKVARPREALFDLAVGSLFHEAMKFREDFYQREVYGPRVRSLRAEAGAEANGLFHEFERILSAVSARLEKGLAETQSLMAQSWDQLRVLLSEQGAEGFVTRFLIERSEALDQMGPPGLEELMAAIHGDAASGYVIAGESYLASGHYEAAHRVLAKALERGGDRDQVSQLSAYARGMSAYLAGDYPESLVGLSEWAESGSAGGDSLKNLAHSAVSSLARLVDGDGRDQTLESAANLLEKIHQAT